MIDLVKFIIILASIILLIRRGFNLGMVMLINSVLLGLLCFISPLEFIKTVFYSVTERTTILLLLFLIMISFLEKILNESGQLEKMIKALERFIPSRRIRLIIMPAFLGFLASPGGAMFSAPFVEKASKELNINAEQKTFINYWFRHIWEYFLPIYPGVIVTFALLNVSYDVFLKLVWLYTPTAVIGGIIFGLLPLKLGKRQRHIFKIEKETVKELFFGILPIAALLFMVIVFKTDMALSLLLILLVMILSYKIPAKNIPVMLKKSISYKVLLSVASIFIFKDLLQTSGLAAGTSQYLSGIGIHTNILFLIIPLLAGILTGVTQAFVGITFPVLMAMLPVAGNLPLFGFAFLCGILGVFLSPVHLCLVLTSEYFHTKISRVYKYLWGPVILLFIVSVIITFILKQS
ncbi:MAG: DUF401 family protein [Armatimonadota bacterium]